MKLQKLTGNDSSCAGKHCPTVYSTDRGSLVLQGYTVSDADLDVPAGEGIVEVPLSLIKELMRSGRLG